MTETSLRAIECYGGLGARVKEVVRVNDVEGS